MSDLTKSIWINAPPDAVFEYFTNAGKTARWSGLRAEIDAVPGGVYRLDMGVAGVVEGEFLKVEPGKFISWEVRAPKGVDVPPGVIEIRLTAEAGGCRVDVRQTGFAPPFDMMASRGWDHHLARLSVAVLGGSPGADSLCRRSVQSLAEQ